MTTLMANVISRRDQATDVVSLELVSANGDPLPAFTAGSHIDVHLGPGLVRQYSLCNGPLETDRYRIAVLKEPAGRGGSRAVHERIRVGDALEISAPRNHFPLAGEARRSVLIAGGIGITPILSMARQLHHLGQDFVLFYTARDAAHTAFADDLKTCEFAERVHVHHSATQGRMDLAKAIGPFQEATHLYCCGPAALLEAVRHTAASAGWPEAHVHHEHFAASVPASDQDAAFDVVIASSGQVLRVDPGSTVAEVLQRQGIPIALSCEQGICGTCLTRVLEGDIDHRDLYLTPQEQAAQDQFLPCCSRARSPRLVLAL